jgi:type IV pilus assembly protein PilY1
MLLALGLTLGQGPAFAEKTDLSNIPLATGSAETILPNLMFILDDSGSMGWSFMPDSVVNNLASNCYRNFGHNRVYYNPNFTYSPPVDANGVSFANASFTSAWDNGFDPVNSNKTNLSTQFRAYDNVTSAGNGSDTAQAAYYYRYSFTGGSFTATNPPSACEANSRYTKVTVSATSGPGGTDERQNFANWYSYYRTRMLTMKTAAGQAFKADFLANFRIGFVTINPASGGSVLAAKYLKIDRFENTHKSNWYTKLYSAVPGGRTPLREALSRVGRHYGGKADGINAGMDGDPMQYSCQQNFALLTTDGFWNSNAGQNLAGGSIGNQDNVVSTADPKYVTRESGTFDGNLLATTSSSDSQAGGRDTLADVAMYYYRTDLRPAGSTNAAGVDVSENNVPSTKREPDGVVHQRMITFTLGLGVPGRMTYRSDYDTATTGDFRKITNGETGCSWEARNSDICNWPRPRGDDLTAIDDLWHAAVNARGKYFSAQNPAELSDGITASLSGASARLGAAAASATSSPNITQTNNYIFSTTYRTVVWDGEMTSERIDPDTGNVIAGSVWTAGGQLDGRVTGTTDSRTIHTFSSTGGNRLKAFLFGNLDATEKSFFQDRCGTTFLLSQCDDLAPSPAEDRVNANKGENMVNYLRGQNAFEGTLYRDRAHVLGDLVNSQPKFVKAPDRNYGEGSPGDSTTAYGIFKNAKKDRQAMVYVAGNDGMLHAFNADSGAEVWAYLPRMVMPNLYVLADNNYATKHRYYVDGSPTVADAFFGGAWKTVLLGGLNAGGRGFYALDVTDPAAPKALWEVCHDSSLCAVSDADMGFSFGNPVVTQRASDGKWVAVVSSGYNNISPGSGKGFLYVLDLADGTILAKVGTGAGDTTLTCTAPALCGPSGLGKLSEYVKDPLTNPVALYVYGGDLWGNLWRFDMSSSTPSVLKLAELKDADGRPQSITTRPELAEINSKPAVFVGTGRYLGVSDLTDPADLEPPLPYANVNSIYGIRDPLSGTGWGNVRDSGKLKQVGVLKLSETRYAGQANSVDWNSDAGWVLDIVFNPGERVNIDPQLVLGTLFVVSNVPKTNACTAGGDSVEYQLDYLTGSYVSTAPDNEIGRKRVGSMTVGAVIVRLPGGQVKVISTAATGEKFTGGLYIGGGGKTGRRINWREIILDKIR